MTHVLENAIGSIAAKSMSDAEFLTKHSFNAESITSLDYASIKENCCDDRVK